MINTPASSNKKEKSVAHKESKRDNTTSLKFIMYGLPISVNESVGEYTSAKYLWLKLESKYQKERPEPEKTDKESEGKPP